MTRQCSYEYPLLGQIAPLEIMRIDTHSQLEKHFNIEDIKLGTKY